MFSLKKLIRPNIAALQAYSSARNEYIGDCILLDANENPYGDNNDNRYPDPNQSELADVLAKRNGIQSQQIIFGNGSDELIDMLIRVFCEPQSDSILICPPTFGMYQVAASISNVAVDKIPLDKNYQLDVASIVSNQAKILFLPNPNSPTGNTFQADDIRSILINFNGLVVLDEAYVEFSEDKSWCSNLCEFTNLVILQTFSKYWALAGCRIGMMYASNEIIRVMKKIKPPYNLNNLSTQKALLAVINESDIKTNANIIISERNTIAESLKQLSFITRVYPSQANFLWVETTETKGLFVALKEAGIMIRIFNEMPNFMRISIGKPKENKQLLAVFRAYKL